MSPLQEVVGKIAAEGIEVIRVRGGAEIPSANLTLTSYPTLEHGPSYRVSCSSSDELYSESSVVDAVVDLVTRKDS